jgi:hypothetical protein
MIVEKPDDPDYIITNDDKLYTFQCWYWLSFGNKSWPAASCVDENGNCFGIALSNIKTKIYGKNSCSL